MTAALHNHGTTAAGDAAAALIASYQAHGERHFLPISLMELARAQQSAQRIIASFGFAAGEYVVVSSSHEVTGQLLPFDRAAGALGLIPCSTENGAGEASRVEAAMRRFGPVAIACPDTEMLEALDVRAVFDGKVVWAQDAAYQQLRAFPGIIARRWVNIGPAVALECKVGEGAHVDRLEWDLSNDVDDNLVLTSRLPRAMNFTDWNSGIRAQIVRAPCRCGNSDPRIISF